MTGVIGLCWEGCSDDSSCSNNQKCVRRSLYTPHKQCVHKIVTINDFFNSQYKCFNGCGHDCLDTVITKPGKCPDTTGMIGTCDMKCMNDKSCPGPQKCVSLNILYLFRNNRSLIFSSNLYLEI